MKVVRVNLGRRSYNTHIGEGALKKLSSDRGLFAYRGPVFVLTNRKINALHGKKLKRHLMPFGKKILFHEVADSEKSKSFPVYIKAIKRLAHFARKRSPLVLAFGGGVISDLAGFVAATYRRGVPYINVPTTLLAQVDSAIGGKVAVDIENAKNIVGDFYQPKMVVCELGFLKTLPEKELRSGLVEIVKYAVIKDRGLFSFIDKNLEKILDADESALEHVIFKSCYIKARIVERDEFDAKGLRAILNFGHTIGHAIESAASYSKSATHGRAVAAGMAMAAFIASNLGMLREEERDKICSLIKKVALKTRVGVTRMKDVLHALSYDKKFVHGTNRFILPERIGSVKVVDNVPQGLIRKIIKKNI